MKKVIVGSENPMKVSATEITFKKFFPDEEFEFVPFKAKSGVADQPRSSAETKEGAFNRVQDCLSHYPEADYWVGLEGGIEESDGVYWSSPFMCIRGKEGQVVFGRGAAFELPKKIMSLVDQGYELGQATDIMFNDNNSKQKGALIGYLTNGLINRQDYYVEALSMAMIPLLNLAKD
ncbi:MAG TPA: inosine/xanthosine triphosphatase [Candidatus Paceibacterota bacterium]|mgnify:CR=1 FL=1|nr:inosine/xanthosine triphosphatase [Candidatus Paceibacterota bacterium]HMO82892.1 inosine/xanthosine triphosphatase [Candidatus Paceibacterota bacterium]